MNIGIIGAGNIGTAITADLARVHAVKLFSSKAYLFEHSLNYIDTATGGLISVPFTGATSSYRECVCNADLVLISLPTFMIKATVEAIAPFLSEHAVIGFVPGAGGTEFLAHQVLEKGKVIFGFERTPYVARISEYGKTVTASKKPAYRIAAIPYSRTQAIARMVETIFNRPCGHIRDYLALSVTPTLHTSRLYDLYKDCSRDSELQENPYFYREWTDSASVICFALDNELHKVCEHLSLAGFHMNDVIPYSVHYGVSSPEQLTQKLRSIRSLTDIKGPVEEQNGHYSINTDSRYFTESFPYRLAIVKGLAELLSLDIPYTDRVLRWYCSFVGKEYYNDKEFCGKDLNECGIPQNYGIHTVEELKQYYERYTQ